MSDEEEVTYPIDDVLAALEHAEHMTLEQIEAPIKEIEAQEEPLPPGDRGVREAATGCDVLQEVQPVSPVDREEEACPSDAVPVANITNLNSTISARPGTSSPAHAGDDRTDQGLVAVEPEGEADQDRCEGH
jgi:hypothetical protein